MTTAAQDRAFLDAALRLAVDGFSVFPLKPRTKVPVGRLVPNGFKNATTDSDTISQWWRPSPDANVGIWPGASGVLVVDIDPRHGGNEAWEALTAEHAEVDTLTVYSGRRDGGRHLYSRHPGGKIGNVTLGPGVHVHADAGYVVAPPSIHPDTGQAYYVDDPDSDGYGIDRRKIQPAPPWLMAMLTQSVSNDLEHCCKPESLDLCVSVSLCLSLKEAIASTLPVDTGQRNRAVFRFARTLKAMPEYANASLAELRAVGRKWHEAAFPMTSGEHPFSDTWCDFVYAWARVKYPKGTGPVVEALERSDAATPPACAADYDPVARRLVCLCRELQRNSGDRPFFLACRVIADLLNVDRTKAARLMNMLCVDGVLTLVYRGRTGRASEYRYVALDKDGTT